MCGRTSVFIPLELLEERFDANHVDPESYRPRYNISPGQPLEVITNENQAGIDQLHWGLVPSWADAIDDGFINARSETAAEKPAFREAWESRPCLVLSTGFYEWQSVNGGPKTPYRIYREDDPAFAMAGLWETASINGDKLSTVTILTTDANELVRPIHDRMPVILPESDEQRWLSGDSDERQELCRPYIEENLDAYEISRRVNNPSNDVPEVIQPASSKQSGLGDFTA